MPKFVEVGTGEAAFILDVDAVIAVSDAGSVRNIELANESIITTSVSYKEIKIALGLECTEVKESKYTFGGINKVSPHTRVDFRCDIYKKFYYINGAHAGCIYYAVNQAGEKSGPINEAEIIKLISESNRDN